MLTGEEIRRLRGMIGLTQAQLAGLVKIQPSALQRIERPEPSILILDMIAVKLQAEFLFQGMDYEASLREIRRASRP